jgi:hypothetical protein
MLLSKVDINRHGAREVNLASTDLHLHTTPLAFHPHLNQSKQEKEKTYPISINTTDRRSRTTRRASRPAHLPTALPGTAVWTPRSTQILRDRFLAGTGAGWSGWRGWVWGTVVAVLGLVVTLLELVEVVVAVKQWVGDG